VDNIKMDINKTCNYMRWIEALQAGLDPITGLLRRHYYALGLRNDRREDKS
jgi:hypothetical protein